MLITRFKNDDNKQSQNISIRKKTEQNIPRRTSHINSFNINKNYYNLYVWLKCQKDLVQLYKNDKI